MTVEQIALQIATASVGTRGVHTTDVTAIEWRRHSPDRYGIRDVYAETEAVVEHLLGEGWEYRSVTSRDFSYDWSRRPTAQDAILDALRGIERLYELGVLVPNFVPEVI